VIFLILRSAAVGWLKTKDGDLAIKHVTKIRKVTMSQKSFSHHITSPLTESQPLVYTPFNDREKQFLHKQKRPINS